MSSPYVTLTWMRHRTRFQRWPNERWQRWQAERLAAALRFAWDQIPYYRRRWSQADVGLKSAPTPDDVGRLPMLSREDLQRHAQELTNPAGHRWGSRKLYSSGSTGPMVWVWHDLSSKLMENLARLRQRQACGLGLGAREAWLLSPRLYGELATRGWVRRLAVRNRFFVPRDEDSRTQWEQLCLIRPNAIQGFPGAMESLADLEEVSMGSIPSLRVIFSTGELLTDGARRHIERSFGVPVRDIYGSSEFGDIAWQCDRGRGYHVNTDLFHVELVGSNSPPGRAGRMVVTSLHNRIMPLVRYDTGDWAVASDSPCGCGRTLPVFTSVTGRTLDRIVSPSGRHVPPYRLINGVITPFVGRHNDVIRRFQVVQESLSGITINVVADSEVPHDEIEALREDAMRALPEPIEVQVSFVDRLEADASGKVKRFLSKLAMGGSAPDLDPAGGSGPSPLDGSVGRRPFVTVDPPDEITES